MPLLGLDYAGGRPGGAAIRAAGYSFVVRYLTSGGAGLPGKLLTLTEYADLQANDVAVVANWETTANRMLGGYQAGNTDARSADTVVRALGHPTTRPIYFSADWDAAPGEQSAIDSYLNGVADAIGRDRTGVYGGYWVVKRCLDNGSARWAWQTGAWSGGNRDPRAHMYQRIGYVSVRGVQCDVNEALKDDYGQHPAPEATMTPDQARMLTEIHHESTLRLPNRRGDGTKQLGALDDTVLGYAAFADGGVYRLEQTVRDLTKKVDKLTGLVEQFLTNEDVPPTS